MTGFLPDNYKRPETSSNYIKLSDGPNKLRILSAPIFFHEYWNTDKKPVRSAEPFKGVPADARLDEGRFKPKYAWALAVWNYALGAVQVWQITQASIQGPLEDLALNEDWGDPRSYDITVTRKGEGMDTEYSVQPSPQKAVPEEAHKAYREARINLEALLEGKDPFSTPSGSQGGDVEDTLTQEDSPFPPKF
jgi:hypothetical protein